MTLPKILETLTADQGAAAARQDPGLSRAANPSQNILASSRGYDDVSSTPKPYRNSTPPIASLFIRLDRTLYHISRDA